MTKELIWKLQDEDEEVESGDEDTEETEEEESGDWESEDEE